MAKSWHTTFFQKLLIDEAFTGQEYDQAKTRYDVA
ncbi:hypothetical protein J2X17_003793 [Flavobacterium aquidurense]|nr:hypothetical protein [Flavobacterium aquidurense]